MTEELKTQDQEVFIELSYEKGYNLGAYGATKKYSFKISGNQSVVEEQIKNHKIRLVKYIKEVESMIDEAHKYNVAKNEIEKTLIEQPSESLQTN